MTMQDDKRIFYQSAQSYYDEGLNVIPCRPRDKMPAVEVLGGTWEQYQARRVTPEEIDHFWNNGHAQLFNIGIVHGTISNNYVTLDLDHDAGLLDEMWEAHSYLFMGRIEQSGSGEGYHIPLRLDQLPDFGLDQRQQRPRGNRTWKTKVGNCNVRAQFCQTIVSPSVHPSGNPYKIVKAGNITPLPNLDDLIAWLNKLAPPPVSPNLPPNRPIAPAQSNDLVNEVKAAWNCLTVFEHFTMAPQQRKEPNGEIRLLGNGGLLITEDLQLFYNFSDEFGGGVCEAWGYCRFGSAYDKRKHFRQVLLEMAEAGGIDIAAFYRRGDEKKVEAGKAKKEWWAKYPMMWEKVR